MRRSFLALLRGRDGRSLAWALALLVALNAFVAGGHMGAAAGDGPVVCTVASHAPGGNGPTAPAQADPCCFAGCVSAATGIVGGEAVLLPLPPLSRGVYAPAASTVAAPRPPAGNHRPRGPPSLA